MLCVNHISFTVYFTAVVFEILIETATSAATSCSWCLSLPFDTLNNFSCFRINFAKWINLPIFSLAAVWGSIHSSSYSMRRSHLLTSWSMLHVRLLVLNLRSHIHLSIYNYWRLVMPLCDISGLPSSLTLSCLTLSLIISTLPRLPARLLFCVYLNRRSYCLR